MKAILSLTLGAVLLATQAPAHALNIVLTNDDGFETTNTQTLFNALVAAGHDVILSAPYTHQSGTSGQIAFLQPMGPTTEDSPKGTLSAGVAGVGLTGLAPQQYYVDGSPAASVLYGIDIAAQHHWGTAPDLVISGPNEGNNLGIVTPHSGTIGATVTALNKNIPAIAVSAATEEEAEAEIVAAVTLGLIASLELEEGLALPAGIGLNLNTPEFEEGATAKDIKLQLTQFGSTANFGLQFYEKLGDSLFAQAFGVPATVELPGVSVNVPTLAGYPEDTSVDTESNALGGNIATVSIMQGTYAASAEAERKVLESMGKTLRPSPERISIESTRITMPDDGWYQVLRLPSYKAVCEGVSVCDVEPGRYDVINHSRGFKVKNLAVPAVE